MSTVAHRASRGHRTIRLPIAEVDYERFLNEGELARAQLDRLYGRHPELFPEGWRQGYVFHGFTQLSRKRHLRCRRIRLRGNDEVFSIAPAFVMPYMTAPVAEVEKALFLMRFHVPCWALAYVFGRDAMYWYRLQQGLGRFSVVGTTVKVPERLPQDLVADEKHSRLEGQKIYIATTAGEGCILGASVSDSASEATLTQAYGVFAEEARAVDLDYAPETVNTDGWSGLGQHLFHLRAGNDTLQGAESIGNRNRRRGVNLLAKIDHRSLLIRLEFRQTYPDRRLLIWQAH